MSYRNWTFSANPLSQKDRILIMSELGKESGPAALDAPPSETDH